MLIKKARLICSLALIAASNVFAVAPGFYLGFSTGPVSNSGKAAVIQTEGSRTILAKPKTNQWGLNLLMGYKFNQWAAFEGGLDFFSKVNFKLPPYTEACTKPSVGFADFHLVGKGSFAVSKVELFGKAGVAYVSMRKSGSLNRPDPITGACGKSSSENLFKPVLGIGVSYDLNQAWIADISWTKIMVGNPVNGLNFIGLGFSYHLVDRYCGQFLCD